MEFPYANAAISDNIYEPMACLVFLVIVITRKIMVSLILRDLKSFQYNFMDLETMKGGGSS